MEVEELTRLLSKDGCHTIKLEYWVARDLKSSATKKHIRREPSNLKVLDWKRSIWQSEIPNKVKIFLWRATDNIIPCASILQSRDLSQSNCCNVCDRDCETTLHALWS